MGELLPRPPVGHRWLLLLPLGVRATLMGSVPIRLSTPMLTNGNHRPFTITLAEGDSRPGFSFPTASWIGGI